MDLSAWIIWLLTRSWLWSQWQLIGIILGLFNSGFVSVSMSAETAVRCIPFCCTSLCLQLRRLVSQALIFYIEISKYYIIKVIKVEYLAIFLCFHRCTLSVRSNGAWNWVKSRFAVEGIAGANAWPKPRHFKPQYIIFLKTNGIAPVTHLLCVGRHCYTNVLVHLWHCLLDVISKYIWFCFVPLLLKLLMDFHPHSSDDYILHAYCCCCISNHVYARICLVCLVSISLDQFNKLNMFIGDSWSSRQDTFELIIWLEFAPNYYDNIHRVATP